MLSMITHKRNPHTDPSDHDDLAFQCLTQKLKELQEVICTLRCEHESTVAKHTASLAHAEAEKQALLVQLKTLKERHDHLVAHCIQAHGMQVVAVPGLIPADIPESAALG
ncbi:hypothetical protein C8R43DRAFT_1134837 [Mycena crocata]|nr:hypothetical protein C8R43DRAFT_1134837 [Mycena crocata]